MSSSTVFPRSARASKKSLSCPEVGRYIVIWTDLGAVGGAKMIGKILEVAGVWTVT